MQVVENHVERSDVLEHLPAQSEIYCAGKIRNLGFRPGNDDTVVSIRPGGVEFPTIGIQTYVSGSLGPLGTREGWVPTAADVKNGHIGTEPFRNLAQKWRPPGFRVARGQAQTCQTEFIRH